MDLLLLDNFYRLLFIGTKEGKICVPVMKNILAKAVSTMSRPLQYTVKVRVC